MLEALGTLADDPAAGARLGRAGRELAERCYDWDVIAAGLEEALTGLAGVS